MVQKSTLCLALWLSLLVTLAAAIFIFVCIVGMQWRVVDTSIWYTELQPNQMELDKWAAANGTSSESQECQMVEAACMCLCTPMLLPGITLPHTHRLQPAVADPTWVSGRCLLAWALISAGL